MLGRAPKWIFLILRDFPVGLSFVLSEAELRRPPVAGRLTTYGFQRIEAYLACLMPCGFPNSGMRYWRNLNIDILTSVRISSPS